MKLARALIHGVACRGEIDGDWFHPFAEGSEPFKRGGSRGPLEGLLLLAPVVPSKILTVVSGFLMGRDPDEARVKGMVFSSKLVSALSAPGAAIVAPILPESMNHPVVAEGELAVVIGRTIRRLRPEEAESAILGFTCVNDVSLRGLAKVDGDFMRSKSVDTFCPMGPYVTTDLDLAATEKGLAITTRINGEVRQSGTTADYVFRVAEAVSIASQLFTLVENDVISLGTPPPPPELVPGDEVEVEVESVGVLRNYVVAEKSGS